jgi:O-antigen/teichoic acid export membrane protein
MGVIARQSIKQSIATYAGIMIGSISTIFIYPRMGTESMGEIAFIQNTAKLIAVVMGIGLPGVSIQYFPYFNKTAEKRGKFLAGMLIATLVSSLITVGIFLLLEKYLTTVFPNGSLLSKYKIEVLFIAFFLAFVAIVQNYTANFGRIVVPSMLQNLFFKIWQPVLVILFLTQIITFFGVTEGIVIGYGIILIGSILYLVYLGKWEWNTQNLLSNKPKLKEIFNYSLFSISVNWGSILAMQIDGLLISLIVGATSLAIFTVPSMIAEAIDVPRKAILGISAPIISNAIKNNDWANVESIYKKSALIQLIVGAFLLSGAWVCSDNLYDLMPKGDEFRAGKYIILILGLARLMDMITGTNTEIISYSEHYRKNLTFLLYLSVINIVGNIILIPLFSPNGAIGAAIATLISISIFNILKLQFIYNTYKIHPLDKSMIYVIGFALIGSIATYYIPQIYNPIVTIIVKGVILSFIYWGGVLYFSISKDINALVLRFYNEFK